MFDINAFWKLVGPPDPVTGCRIWQGKKWPGGYGRCSRPHRVAHRAVWILANGPIPIVNGRHLNINHTRNCTSRACCEPTHIYLGTQYENIMDLEATMTVEERQRRNESRQAAVPRGEDCYNAILTRDDVVAIRKAEGVSIAQLARDYGVSWGTIKKVRNRESWKEV